MARREVGSCYDIFGDSLAVVKRATMKWNLGFLCVNCEIFLCLRSGKFTESLFQPFVQNFTVY